MPVIYQNGNWYGGKDYGHDLKDDGLDVTPRKNLDFVDFDLTDSAADDEIKIKPHQLTNNEVNDILSDNVLSGQKPLGIYSDDLVPLGIIICFLGDVVPDGFLLCDGSEYDKEEYPELAYYLLAVSDDYGGTTKDKFKVPLVNDYLGDSSLRYCIKY